VQGPLGALAGKLARRMPTRLRNWMPAIAMGMVLLASAAAVAFQAARRPEAPFRWLSFQDKEGRSAPPCEHYWSDFRDLLGRFQEDTRLCRTDLLGSLDSQWLTWWTAFGPGRVFVGPAFTAVVSDQVQERRLLLFCRLVGVSDDQFPRLMRLYYVNAQYLGCAKYQATRAYTFSPLEDYDPADRPRIRRKSVDDGWHLVIPRSELRRLARAYAETSLGQCEFRLPDVVVLTSYELDLGLRPPEAQYAEVHRNATFTVWVRREAP